MGKFRCVLTKLFSFLLKLTGKSIINKKNERNICVEHHQLTLHYEGNYTCTSKIIDLEIRRVNKINNLSVLKQTLPRGNKSDLKTKSHAA